VCKKIFFQHDNYDDHVNTHTMVGGLLEIMKSSQETGKVRRLGRGAPVRKWKDDAKTSYPETVITSEDMDEEESIDRRVMEDTQKILANISTEALSEDGPEVGTARGDYHTSREVMGIGIPVAVKKSCRRVHKKKFLDPEHQGSLGVLHPRAKGRKCKDLLIRTEGPKMAS
jgi:hypothetical protein